MSRYDWSNIIYLLIFDEVLKSWLYNSVNYWIDLLVLVNCEWSEWILGDCSKECGGGARINKRVHKSEASHGGDECSGDSNSTQPCNIQECPGTLFWLFKVLFSQVTILKIRI